MDGHACRSIEESAWESGPPPIPELGTPSDVPESATRVRRSSIDTLPASDPVARLSASHPEWCVDAGEQLLTMTTFELWEAIERSHVAPWMRVWREGMECWTPVRHVPELRWAVASAQPLTPAPAVPDPVEDTMEADLTASDTPPADEATTEATTGPIALQARTPVPPPEAVTPANDAARAVSRQSSRGSLPEATPSPAPRSTVRPREGSRGARWIAAGSAVAAMAVGTALLRAADPPVAPALQTQAAGVAPGADRPAPPARVSPPTPVEAPAAEPVLDEEDAPATPPVTRREERGQHRQPRGGRHAYGR